MKNNITFGFVGLLIVIIVVFSGCIDEVTGSAIAKSVIECEEPYMRHETGCCLDEDNNDICDEHDGEIVEIIEKEAEEPTELETKSAPELIVTESDKNVLSASILYALPEDVINSEKPLLTIDIENVGEKTAERVALQYKLGEYSDWISKGPVDAAPAH